MESSFDQLSAASLQFMFAGDLILRILKMVPKDLKFIEICILKHLDDKSRNIVFVVCIDPAHKIIQ